MSTSRERQELLEVQAALQSKEEEMRGEIAALEMAVARISRLQQNAAQPEVAVDTRPPLTAAQPKVVVDTRPPPTAAEPEDAVDILTNRLEQMVAQMHAAGAVLDRRDAQQESLSQASTEDKFASATTTASLQPPPNVARAMSSGMRSIVRDIADRESAALIEEEDDDNDVAAEEDHPVSAPQSVTNPGLRMHHSAVMQSGRAILLRQILTAYFTKHAPDSVHKVENLVARVVGGPPSALGGVGVVGGVLWDEVELFAKLEAKYGARVDLDPHYVE
jgi:hypothetical protein